MFLLHKNKDINFNLNKYPRYRNIKSYNKISNICNNVIDLKNDSEN